MRRGVGRRLGLAAVGAAAALGLGLWVAGVFREPVRPHLTAAATAADTAAVRVGPNVHVSAAAAAVPHMGCELAADPGDPRRLYAASTLGQYQDVAGYYSHDGGASWHPGGKRPHGPTEQVADEDVAFGPAGELYVANMRVPNTTPGAHPYGTPDVGHVDFARSTDGGKTWEERGSVPRYVDRPCLAVDGTRGPRRGRVYVNANVEEPVLLSSGDGAGSFAAGVFAGPAVRTTRPSNPVVLTDGTVVLACCVFGGGGGRRLALPVWESTDGGATAAYLTRNLAADWAHLRVKSASVWDVFYPRLAAAPGGSRSPDRLYCVWRDGTGPDESYVLFAQSRDRGRTWSDPVVLSEQPLGPDARGEYQADIPSVAVNPAGVVAASWYDRRGLPPHAVGPGGVIPPAPGYNVRLRVSRDGGETWHPSVQLNEVPAKADRVEARHWAGLAAAADGRFHAAWIGDTTGTMQVWTAAIDVPVP